MSKTIHPGAVVRTLFTIFGEYCLPIIFEQQLYACSQSDFLTNSFITQFRVANHIGGGDKITTVNKEKETGPTLKRKFLRRATFSTHKRNPPAIEIKRKSIITNKRISRY